MHISTRVLLGAIAISITMDRNFEKYTNIQGTARARNLLASHPFIFTVFEILYRGMGCLRMKK